MDLGSFLNSPYGLALQGALAAAFLDFAFGTFYALRDGTFALDAVAAFVRKHLMGRVFPIGVMLGVGYVTNNLVMQASAAAALTAYAAETMGSIYASVTEPKAEAVSSIPKD